MPYFLNPISSRAAYPNGAEAWSGYGMPQGMDASMFTQDFGPSSASHKPFNPMNGPGVPGNGSDKGMSNRRNAQGMDGNGGMGPGSGQIDNGGMNQWDSWNFRSDPAFCFLQRLQAYHGAWNLLMHHNTGNMHLRNTTPLPDQRWGQTHTVIRTTR